MDINNEGEHKNATYRDNLLSLNALNLLYTTTDNVVVPSLSPWFSFYAPGEDKTLVPMNETAQYAEDWIGLRTLDAQGKLLRTVCDCHHGAIPTHSCRQQYVNTTRGLLNNTL